MMGLGELGDLGGNNNEYKEDTRLEDRLAMEAEEEKKYETGEGYGGGGGGGGGAGWEDSGKGVNWATNIQRQDAAEVKNERVFFLYLLAGVLLQILLGMSAARTRIIVKCKTKKQSNEYYPYPY